MSGGVDSSVAAALLREQGCDVIGLTAVMSPGFSRCCSDDDVATAREVAAQVGIPHRVVDLSAEFRREVIEYFMREYLAGRTPSPCARCNRCIKFGALLREAQRLGAEYLATGHYARVREDDQGCRLLRGKDARKDQSYFLALLTQDQLRRSCFPLGRMTKERVTDLARRLGLAARHSRESQELCFVDTEDHGTWIDVRCLETRGWGDIVDARGVKLGEHHGIHHYTVGQRRGLGVAAGHPVYVTALDVERNRVVVGERAEAMRAEMEVADLSWVAGRPPSAAFRALAQIRYNHAAAPAQVRLRPDGGAHVQFDEPQFAVAPGQLAVLYDGEEVLGGGWIGQEEAS
jgi:tRNA-uridine 2-sulfurtransferase